MVQIRTSPSQYKLPDDAVEQLGQRLINRKVFRRPNGVNIAVFGGVIHYEPVIGAGAWEDADTLFRASGQAQVADHLQHSVRVQGRNLDVTDRATGKGIRFTLPVQNTVSGNSVSFTFNGINFTYNVTKRGIKLSGVVAASVGPKHFSFPYARLGGAASLSLNLDGSIQGDGFVLPAPFVEGANGITYQAGAWTFTDTALEFDWDDTTLPAAAYPYTLDPSTSFSIAASGDDGIVTRTGTVVNGWPPTGAFTVTTNGTSFQILSNNDGAGTYNYTNAFTRWDTSSLTDTIYITRAWVRFRMQAGPGVVNAKSVLGEFYDFGAAIDSTDYTDAINNDAHIGTLTSAFGSGEDGDYYIRDTSQISLTGLTGIRWALNPAVAPTGTNSITVVAFDHASSPEPQLFIEYLDAASIPTSPSAPSSKVITTAISNAGASTTPYSTTIAHGLGAAPKFIIAFAMRHSGGGSISGLQISQGFWANSKERAVGMAVQDAQASITGLYRAVSNSKTILIPNYTGGTAFAVHITSVDATNINVDITDNIGSSTQIDLAFLAITNPNIIADIQDISIPTTGQQYGTDINFGFKPDLLMCLSADDTTWAETITNAQAMLSFGACDELLNQWVNTITASFSGTARAVKATSGDAIRAAVNFDLTNWCTVVITALTATGVQWFVRNGSTSAGSIRVASVLGIKGVLGRVGGWTRTQYQAYDVFPQGGSYTPEALVLCTNNANQRDATVSAVTGLEAGGVNIHWGFGFEGGPTTTETQASFGVAAANGGASSDTNESGVFTDLSLYKTKNSDTLADGGFFINQMRTSGGYLEPIYSQFGLDEQADIQFIMIQPKQRGTRIPRKGNSGAGA